MSAHDVPVHDGPSIAPRKWYRTTIFNAFIIGGVGFVAPGLWDAMNALGAGGAEKPYLVNAANALVFGLMGFLCLFGAPIANRIGLNWTLSFGGLGYPIYSAGLYTNNRYGNEWLVLVGAVACGLSAGLFWASEGAVALGYPEPSKKGRYINIWLWFRTAGPMVGGAIVLGLNADTESKGSVKSQTYLIFVALQCLAVPLAIFLSPPEKVQRSDGTLVKIEKEDSWAAEFRALGKASMKKEILLLLPAFWASYFNQYSSNFETYYFGVRARALVGFVSNLATLFSSWIISRFLDFQSVRVTERLRYSFIYVVILHIIAWVYGWVVQEKYTANPPTLDWSDKGYTRGLFVVLLWQFSKQALQNWLYYLVSTMTDNISELARFSGIFRGQESFAQAVSYGINTRNWYGGRVPLAVNTILLGIMVLPTWLVVQKHIPVGYDAKVETSSKHSQQDVERKGDGEDKAGYTVGSRAVGGQMYAM